jgi:hypothetical protein
MNFRSDTIFLCTLKTLKTCFKKRCCIKKALECAELNNFHEQKMRNEYLYTTVGDSPEGKLAP